MYCHIGSTLSLNYSWLKDTHFSKYRQILKIVIFGLKIWRLQKSGSYRRIVFLIQGVERNQAYILSKGSSFRDRCRFSKFLYLAMKKSRKLQTFCFSIPGCWNGAYLRFKDSGFRDTKKAIFKLVIFGHVTWILNKIPKVGDALSFNTQGLELCLFSLYRIMPFPGKVHC